MTTIDTKENGEMNPYEEILAYVTKRKAVSIPEIQCALGLGYRDVSAAVERLVGENVLKYDDGVVYTVIPPEAKEEQKPPVTDEQKYNDLFIRHKEMLLRRIKDLDFNLQDPDGSDDDDDDDELDDIDDIDFGDDNDALPFGPADISDTEGAEVEEIDAEDDLDFGDSPFDLACKEFGELVPVTREGEVVYMELFTDEPESSRLKVGIIEKEDGVYLCDRGEAQWNHGQLACVTEEQIEAAVDVIAAKYGAERRDGNILYKLREGYDAVSSLLAFYAVFRRIADLDESEIDLLTRTEMSPAFRAILGGALDANPELDLDSARRYVEKVYGSIKDNGKYGDIAAHASLLYELQGFDEKGYEKAKARYFERRSAAFDRDAQYPLLRRSLPQFGLGAGRFAIGLDMSKNPIVLDPFSLKNFLIAGGGKDREALIKTLIAGIFDFWPEEETRVVICGAAADAYRVTRGCAHLLTGEVYGDAEFATGVLEWAFEEALRRRTLIENAVYLGRPAKDYYEYNICRPLTVPRLERIVIFIDELGDGRARASLRNSLLRLLPVSVNAGISIVLSDNESDELAGMFDAVAAFRLSLKERSDVLFGVGGAETLKGVGEMYLRTAKGGRVIRARCARLTRLEFDDVCFGDRAKAKKGDFDLALHRKFNAIGIAREELPRVQVLGWVVKGKETSIELIHEKFKLPYGVAAQIVEWMKRKGYLSTFDAKTQKFKVRLTKKEFLKIYGTEE